MEGYETPPAELDNDDSEESLALAAIWDAIRRAETTESE